MLDLPKEGPFLIRMSHYAKGPKQVGVADTTPSVARDMKECESRSVSRLNCPVYYVFGRVEGRVLKMMFDSGSGVSMMSEECLNTFAPRPKLLPVDVCLTGLGETQLPHTGLWTTMVRLGGNNVCVPFVIVKGLPYDVILGAEFADRHGVIVDCKHHRLRLSRGSVPLQRETRSVVFGAVLREAVEVPARHEALFPAWLDGDFEGEGFIEGHSGFEQSSSLLVARVAVRVAEGCVPVRVVNTTQSNITIPKGTSIGVFTETVDRKVPVKETVVDPLEKCKMGDNMTEDQRQRLQMMLAAYTEVFSQGPHDLGRTNRVYHEINTADHRPIKQAPRRLPYHRQVEVRKIIAEMERNGIIRPSESPWASPVVLVTKPDSTLRFCIDMRRLNDVTIKDAYPLPRIDDSLDQLTGSRWYTSLDLASGYWQVELKPEDREKTAFTTMGALYEFNVMPFGLCNAPGTFQRLMDCVLAGLQWNTCLVYIDDIIIYSRTFDEHLIHLQQVFDRLKDSGLKVKPSKCSFCVQEVLFLGHKVSEKGISANPAKIAAVQGWPVPTNLKEVRSFVGLASYYRKFIKSFSTMARPLTRLMEKNAVFKWTEDCQEAFTILKVALTTSPILSFPQFELPFILDTDASDFGLGYILSQVVDGKEHVISYGSRTLSRPERNYCVTRRELLAVVEGVKHYKHYLTGRKFTIRTDHGSLTWLVKKKEPEGQVARWIEVLSGFEFEIKHRPGQLHRNADALSRVPCKQCTRVGVHVVEVESEFGRQQQEDLEMGPVFDAIRQGTLLESPRPRTKYITQLVQQWESLQVVEDVLRRVFDDGKSQRIVPTGMVKQILSGVHDLAAGGGHLGIRKTLSKVKDKYYWPGWRRDVEVWCKTCPECVRRKKQIPSVRAPLHGQIPGFPFQRVGIDVLGPLPLTNRGNKYIIVVQDYYTKWVEAYAVPDQEATTVARRLVDDFVCRFGAPFSLHSDQGRNFESKIFQEMCQQLGITKTRTTSYHPMSDGLVERFNRTLESMLSQYVNEAQVDWDIHLPKVLMAFRCGEQESTGFSPNYLVFGREIGLPVELVVGSPEEDKDLSSYVRNQRNAFVEAFSRVNTKLLKSHDKQKVQYDRRSTGNTELRVGDSVWLFNPSVKRGRTKKLSRAWSGPLTVIKCINPVIFRVSGKVNGRRRREVVHRNRLRKAEGIRKSGDNPLSHPPEHDDVTGTGLEMLFGLEDVALLDGNGDEDVQSAEPVAKLSLGDFSVANDVFFPGQCSTPILGGSGAGALVSPGVSICPDESRSVLESGSDSDASLRGAAAPRRVRFQEDSLMPAVPDAGRVTRAGRRVVPNSKYRDYVV